MSPVPVMPVVMGTNSAFLLRMTKTPCTSCSGSLPLLFLDAVLLGMGAAACTEPGVGLLLLQLRRSADRECLNRDRKHAAAGSRGDLAVVERPGRRSCGGSVTVTTTLKSLASSAGSGLLESPRRWSGRWHGPPISETVPWKTFLGMASIVTSGGLTQGTLTISVSSTFYFGSDYRHVGQRHQYAAERILNAMTTDSPSRTGKLVMTPS